jgi:hypothetical protein
MIRLLHVLVVVFVFASTSTMASEIAEFFNSTVSQLWSVRGSVMKEQLIGPTCTAETKYTDGSYVHLSKDIDEQLYFLWVHNTEWNFAEKEIVIRLDFFDQKGQLGYASLRAIVHNGDSLDIPLENPKAFLERFMLSAQIQFTVPMRNGKFKVAVDKPFQILDEFGKCVDAWTKEKVKLGAQEKH